MASSTSENVEDVVYETVAGQFALKKEEVKSDMNTSENARIFFRIVTDIERKLDLSALKGNWVFEDKTVEGLVNYYRKILDER